MNLDLAKDRFVTHGFTNYLAAAYQGKFAFANVLFQFQHPTFSEEELLKTQQTMTKIFTWNKQLYEDECLFSASWTTPETFESQNAVTLLEQLKPELYKQASEAQRILGLQEQPLKDDLVYVLGLYSRNAYSRDTYARGFIEYANNFSLPEMEKRYQPLLAECEFELRRDQDLINMLRNAKGEVAALPPEFFAILYQSSLSLPATLRSHVHDINQLISQFKGGLSWSTSEFTKAEAELWSTAGLGPSAAGYFRAFGIGPDEAGQWRTAGVPDATMAVEWKRGAFSPESAKPWIEAGIPPPLAYLWLQNKYEPEEAKEFISKGTYQPPFREPLPQKKPMAEKPESTPKPPKKMSYPKRV